MKKFESIIELLSKEDAQHRRYDPNEQELVRINDNTGEVVSGFISRFSATSSYYLVSNSNLVRRAMYTSPKFIIEDRNGRKIELHVECEVSCPPGNEIKVAKFLHSTGKLPVIKLNGFISRCVNKFRSDDEQFIDNFFDSNIAQQIEDFIIGQNEESDVGNRNEHVTGLKFHTVKCVFSDPDRTTFFISLRDLKIGFNDSIERHAILFDCKLAVDEKNETNARVRNLTKADFEAILRNIIPEIFDKFISEDDIYGNFQKVENTLRTNLDERLQKYGRRISALNLQDLDLRDLESKRTVKVEIKKRKYFALDREVVELEALLTALIKNPTLIRPYKNNLTWLKNKLENKAEDGVAEFISEINSGEFYSEIEKPNSNFRERFVQSVRNKICQIIDVEIIDSKIETGREEETIKIDSLREQWIPFNAHIDSQYGGECSVKGSFIVTGDAPLQRAMRKPQKFNSENIKNKIIETLEAWLDKYSVSTIISANHHAPEKFEKALKKLLLDKVVEAHGVIINIQNIKTEIINQAAPGVNIGEAIAQVDGDIINGLIEGFSDERIGELKRRKAKLLEFQKERREVLGQSAVSSNHADATADFENGNALLSDVNRLLLEEKHLLEN
jgi:hypothetical protein